MSIDINKIAQEKIAEMEKNGEIKKQPKICSTVIRRKLFRGIMHALNPFILLSNVNGSIALKFATISRHTS